MKGLQERMRRFFWIVTAAFAVLHSPASLELYNPGRRFNCFAKESIGHSLQKFAGFCGLAVGSVVVDALVVCVLFFHRMCMVIGGGGGGGFYALLASTRSAAKLTDDSSEHLRHCAQRIGLPCCVLPAKTIWLAC